MAPEQNFDLQAAHRYFSVDCFNRAWELIEKPERTSEEDESMIQLSLTSAWHWSQRGDCLAGNRSVAYWQISHIYALLGQANNAQRYASLCLDFSQGEGTLPYHQAYAYEALARAEAVAGNADTMQMYLDAARQVAERMGDLEAKQWLLNDLETIRV